MNKKEDKTCKIKTILPVKMATYIHPRPNLADPIMGVRISCGASFA
jgi:hypothetical protein